MEFEEFETPIGKQKVKIKKWLTGGDRRDLNLFLFKDVNLTLNPANPEAAGIGEQQIPGEKLIQLNDLTIEKVVVEVDGSSEDILKRVLEMDARDYDFILDKCNQVSGQREFTEKKR